MITATRSYIAGLATALAQENNVKIEAGDCWSADIRNRRLIYNERDLLSMTPENAKGLVIHEVGHLLYTADTKETELEKQHPIMHQVYNAFEDIRIEHKLSQKFGDFADAPLQSVKEAVLDEMPKDTIPDTSPASQLRQALTHTILNATEQETQQSKFRASNRKHNNADTYYEKTNNEGRTLVNNLNQQCAYGSDTINQLVNASDIDELKRIVDRDIYPILKDTIDQIPQQEQQRIKQELKKETQAKPKGGTHKTKQVFHQIPSDTELDQILSPYINTLSRNLGQVLKERRASKLTGLHKGGKLLSVNAYRVLTGETRIFSRKTNPDKADYKITVLLDGSGSMRNKHVNTYIGGYLLTQVVKKLGFDLECIRFDDSVTKIRFSEYRDFIDQQNNDDAGALAMAYDHLDRTKENIVLMLSDGSICTKVAPEVEKLRKAGVTLLGVGVGLTGDELQRHYGNAVNVPDVSQLPSALISILKRLIHR